MKSVNHFLIIYLSVATLLCAGCRKLIGIDEPTDKITATKMFDTDAGAKSAMAGVYSVMINGRDGQGTASGPFNYFAAGESTYLGALSADEMVMLFTIPPYNYNTNQVIATQAGFSDYLWESAYAAIYGANAVIDGISASTSSRLSETVRTTLTGEAKFVRAFSYFYLVNFFGDVPLVLTSDPNTVANLARSPVAGVYEQVIQDLKDAQAVLPADYAASSGKRIRATKWSATAMLARVYLYTGNYSEAAAQASAVIGHTDLFGLEPDLNRVFLTGSREAIWQLEQNINNPLSGNATGEGYAFLPNPLYTGPIGAFLAPSLLNAFESGDQRREKWIDSTEFTLLTTTLAYHSHKYKTGNHNLVIGGAATEYYMALRLAEQYLIRAEAAAKGSEDAEAAIADLNVIRHRAGLPNLPASLSGQALTDAIAHEWQTEFFCEWGHRWFNLKRTKTAHDVLSAIPYKKPWAGDFQLLYPIPVADTLYNNALTQNPGY